MWVLWKNITHSLLVKQDIAYAVDVEFRGWRCGADGLKHASGWGTTEWWGTKFNVWCQVLTHLRKLYSIWLVDWKAKNLLLPAGTHRRRLQATVTTRIQINGSVIARGDWSSKCMSEVAKDQEKTQRVDRWLSKLCWCSKAGQRERTWCMTEKARDCSSRLCVATSVATCIWQQSLHVICD